MTIPSTATVFSQLLDPDDTQDFYVQVTQGDAATDMLRTGEVVTAFSLALTAESVAAGLQLLNSGGYETYFASNLFSFWLAVDPTRRQQAVFAAGATLGIELTITSNEPNKPSRIRNRTFGVKVVSQ